MPCVQADGGANLYVSGLAEEVTEEELLECFKVAGLFKLDAETQRPKLKMYKDAAGRRKGDALLSFIKPESVALAVTLRDGYELRPGRPISVVPTPDPNPNPTPDPDPNRFRNSLGRIPIRARSFGKGVEKEPPTQRGYDRH